MQHDRFEGEACEPPVVMYCGYCGGAIRQGCGYYAWDAMAVCDNCAKRFAWAQFEQQAQRRTALPENWI